MKEFILDKFPGGKWETEDENFSVTAAKTHEEVGIHRINY
jgi:hypothetical protein